MVHQFDELAKALAGDVPRRKALRLLGGTLAGALLAALSRREARAAPSECAVLCGKNAFISGPLHAACRQACQQCEADITRICFSPTGARCCPPETTCCPTPTGSTCCPAGQVCCSPAGCCEVGRVCCGPAGCCPAGQVCCFDPFRGPFCGIPGTENCPPGPIPR